MDANAQLPGSWAMPQPALHETAGPACATHGDSRAVARCLTCGRALCEACQVTVRGRDYCPLHAAEARAAAPAPAARVAWSQSDLTDPWTRAIASGIDLTVLTFVWAGLCLAAVWLAPLWAVNWLCAFAAITAALFIPIYFTLLVGRYGQTIGHGVLGLRVLRTDGTPVSCGRAFLRCLGGALCLATAFIGFAPTLCNRNRQGLHDKLADTVVVGERLPVVTKAWASLLLVVVMAATLVALTPLLALAC